VDVKDAFQNGADHIVVGRPLRDAPDPISVIGKMQADIVSTLSTGEMNM
jgi:orotidine-5'-phosphate decarboxylase